MNINSAIDGQQSTDTKLRLGFASTLCITTAITIISLWELHSVGNYTNHAIPLLLGLLLLAATLTIGLTYHISCELSGEITAAITMSEQIASSNFNAVSSSFGHTPLVSALKKMSDKLDTKRHATYSSEAQAKAIVETANDAIITIDDRGIISSANPSTEQIFGYQVSEMVGENISMLMPEPDKSQHDGYLKHHIDTGDKRIIGTGREVVGQHKNGTTIPAFLTVSRVTLGDKIIFCGVLHDLSKEKDNQKQLIQAGKLASLGTLTTGIAHELRQPLAVIQLTSENTLALIEEGETLTWQEVSDTFQQVVNNCDRMNRIVNHLRSFARDDDTQVMEAISLVDVLNSSFTLLDAQLHSHGIEVTTHIAEALPAIRGNAHQLEQILINLLTNSRDALTEIEEPAININIQQSGATITLTLADNGPGIPLEVQPKIFDPFFTTKEIGKGTGLGLSISHGIISDHNGTLSYSERQGGGAEFTLALPIIIDESDS